MPLDKPTLIADLQKIFDDESVVEVNPALSRQRVASKMADAIEKYVRSARVKYNNGLTAGSTPVTGNFNGGLE